MVGEEVERKITPEGNQVMKESLPENGAVSPRSADSNPSEEELASKTIQIQAKRFYLDVKQNQRGRFMKIAEVGAGGRKNRLLFSMTHAKEFNEHLKDFDEHSKTLGEPNPDNITEDGKLKSTNIVGIQRRYYMDLKENARGRFLRVSQTQSRGGPRSQIAIPSQGLQEFGEALNGLLEEYFIEDDENAADLPQSKSMRVESKMFYFDIGQNNRGTYMRVSEVRNNFRAAITIPERAWPKIRDILDEYLASVEEKPADDGDAKPLTDMKPNGDVKPNGDAMPNAEVKTEQ